MDVYDQLEDESEQPEDDDVIVWAGEHEARHVAAPLRLNEASLDDLLGRVRAAEPERLGPVPTLLERDFNFPPFEELLREVADIRRLQQPYVLQAAEAAG